MLVLFLYFSKIRNQKCPLQETYEAVKLTRIFGLEGCRQIYSGKTCNSARMLIVLIKNKLDLNVNRDEEDESGQVNKNIKMKYLINFYKLLLEIC